MPKPRKEKTKRLHKKLWIYSEGEKTEIIYLNGYIKEKNKNLRLIDIVEVLNVKQNTPKSLVQRIIQDQSNKEHHESDSYWVAYDREAVAKYSDKLHQEALDLAKASKVNVALSNICIEQWILWHLVESEASYTSCDNLLAQSPLKKELAGLGVTNYDKSSLQVFEAIKGRIDGARARAKRMNSRAKQSSPEGAKVYQLSPYSDFYKILDAIDEFISSHESKPTSDPDTTCQSTT